ncbi:MAG: glycoside hydrolase family 9 protein [candidate division WOR-3 bacterium]
MKKIYFLILIITVLNSVLYSLPSISDINVEGSPKYLLKGQSYNVSFSYSGGNQPGQDTIFYAIGLSTNTIAEKTNSQTTPAPDYYLTTDDGSSSVSSNGTGFVSSNYGKRLPGDSGTKTVKITIPSHIPDGEYYIVIIARDYYLDQATDFSYGVSLSKYKVNFNQPPLITDQTTPFIGSASTLFNFSAVVEDPEEQDITCALYIDEQLVLAPQTKPSGSLWSYQSTLPLGLHFYRWVAYDTFNSTTVYSGSIKVIENSPEIKDLTSPSTGSLTTIFIFKCVVIDPENENVKVTLKINNQVVFTDIRTSGSEFLYTISAQDLGGIGDYLYSWEAEDINGNKAESVFGVINVRGDSPPILENRVSPLAPLFGDFDTQFLLEVKAIQTDNPISKVELYIDDVQKTPTFDSNSQTYKFQVTGSQLGWGEHKYKWIAYDNKNNPSNPVEGLIRVASNRIKVNQIGYHPNFRKIAFLTHHDTQVWNSYSSKGVPPSNPPTKARIINVKTNSIVLDNIPLSTPEWDENSWDYVQEIDFSSLTSDGIYCIEIDGVGRSCWFRISKDVYYDVFKTVFRSYYLQRCGIGINDKISGVYHDVCHTNDALYFRRNDAPTTKFDAGTPNKGGSDTIGTALKVVPLGFFRGGWHDAGDYNKYTTTIATVLLQFFWKYEKFPELFKDDDLDIPESGNGIPDILDEAKYALEFLLKMQIPQGGLGDTSIGQYVDSKHAGAVYHKCTNYDFGPFIPPDIDGLARYIAGITPTDVGLFAGCMAQAARIYKNIYPDLAEKAKQAAIFAWDWLETIPENDPSWIGGDTGQQPENMHTGPYLSRAGDIDERFVAAVELFKLTGEQKYENYILSKYYDENNWKTELGAPVDTIYPFNWADMHTLGMFDYFDLLQEKIDKAETLTNQQQQAYNFIKEKIFATAERVLKVVNNEYTFPVTPYNYPSDGKKYDNKYRVALVGGYKFSGYGEGDWPYYNEFVWASNKLAVAYAEILIFAYELSKKLGQPNKEYLEVALDQLHYVLGRNAVNKCFVTGIGWNQVAKPHHRYCQPAQVMIPGQLVGGPNKDGADYTKPNETSSVDLKSPAGDPMETTLHPYPRYDHPYGVLKKGDPYPISKSYFDDWNAYASNEYAIDYPIGLVLVAKYFSPTKPTLPKVKIISPNENTPVDSYSMLIKAVVDNPQNVKLVQFNVDGGAWQTMEYEGNGVYSAFYNDGSNKPYDPSSDFVVTKWDHQGATYQTLGGGWSGVYGDDGGSLVNGKNLAGAGGDALLVSTLPDGSSPHSGDYCALFSWDFRPFDPLKSSIGYAYAGQAAFFYPGDTSYEDISGYTGLYVWLWGDYSNVQEGDDSIGALIRVQLTDVTKGSTKESGVEWWGVNIMVKPGWNRYVIPLSKFRVPAWATPGNGLDDGVFNTKKIRGVEFVAETADVKGTIAVDDIVFYKGYLPPTENIDLEASNLSFKQNNLNVSVSEINKEVLIEALVRNKTFSHVVNVRVMDENNMFSADSVVVPSRGGNLLDFKYIFFLDVNKNGRYDPQIDIILKQDKSIVKGSVSLSASFVPQQLGEYVIGLILDPSNEVVEETKVNNVITKTLYVGSQAIGGDNNNNQDGSGGGGGDGSGTGSDVVVDTTSPSKITTLTAKLSKNFGYVELSWLAPGDDGILGKLNGTYIIKYTNQNISENFNWEDNALLNILMISTSNVTSGTLQSFSLGPLVVNTTYFFRIWTKDDANNISEPSNIASIFIPFFIDTTTKTISGTTALPKAEVTPNYGFINERRSFSLYINPGIIEGSGIDYISVNIPLFSSIIFKQLYLDNTTVVPKNVYIYQNQLVVILNSKTDKLIKIDFSANLPGQQQQTFLIVELGISDNLSDKFICIGADVDGNVGNSDNLIVEVNNRDFRLENVVAYPSPTKYDYIYFTYRLSKPAKSVKIYVFSITGILIDIIDAPVYGGYNEILWQKVKQLNNGVYVYKIVAEEASGQKVTFIDRFSVLR